ncbi:hypothetical protein [Microbacterium sp.]|uniref:hypothetical protein n=1 Tax=Microbacterium sp. TaxID=51671 RepID=UPI002811DDA1|nr:hypothetical protein [Microbacterium sp.]
MILIILLAATAIWAIVAGIIEIRRDGYRQEPTDWSRVAERDVLHRAESGHAYR